MATNDDQSDHQPRRLIYQVRRRVQAARNQYYAEALQGNVRRQTVRDLAEAALMYHDVLREHRDEDILEPEWDERGLDWLRGYIGETVPVEQPAPGMSSNTVTEEVPAIFSVNPKRIVNLTEKLDDVSKELGLSVNVTESDPSVHVDDDLIEEVEEWRKRNLEE